MDGKTRYVELVLVHDQAQYKRHGSNVDRLHDRSKQLVNIISSVRILKGLYLIQFY